MNDQIDKVDPRMKKITDLQSKAVSGVIVVILRMGSVCLSCQSSMQPDVPPFCFTLCCEVATDIVVRSNLQPAGVASRPGLYP